MNITLRAEVTQVKKSTEYNYKTNKYEDTVTSELRILKNNDGITGWVTLQGELKFGGLHQIIVGTEPSTQVVSKDNL